MGRKWLMILLLWGSGGFEQSYSQARLAEQDFKRPPAESRPWVFWYWMQAAVSKEGIRADLEAMKEVGIAGAYLMPIKDTTSPPLYQPAVRQLSTTWWQMVQYAMQEAQRLDLKLAMHLSDGFALAGGPWITPEMSMQKLVWTKTFLKTDHPKIIRLEQPEATLDYYQDIAVFAYPANSRQAFADTVLIPSVTASNGSRPSFLCFSSDGKESFRSDTSCWIEYKYPMPFTCRSVRIHTGGNNYQAQRLIIEASNDGMNFTTVTRLDPPRHGWQDTDEDNTYSIPPTTARYFRFVYDKEGSEPGAEDLDAAKWKPVLKVMEIHLSDEPVIHQYESKNGSVWRLGKRTNGVQLSASAMVPLSSVIDITAKMKPDGELAWDPPPGNWVVVRIGHTSTGHTNATGGAGKGLEADKFNAVAIRTQFDNWFGKAFEKTGSNLAKQVLKVFHVDSWECGSQNWSPEFPKEFRKRRGYDLMPYLLAMTGVPLQDITTSENVLHDVRQTIAELINDVFYRTLQSLAHGKGCQFSAESVAPTMLSDGLLHYQNVDIPMGEFWLNSPTHDKPNDMLDAISGAHIYGKPVIQAEAFTSVRMNWGEHPGNLKAVGDRNFALGINKMVLHVFTHNPWLDRKPGMTLDGVGLYFQRDQTWFKQGKAWIDYLSRCQYLLTKGKPVVDIAVFTGEELPRRSLLPDRLVSTLPGLFGARKLEEEKQRLQNAGQPLRTIPDGVTHSANMADPEDWLDALGGYHYDSFNPDVLLNGARVEKGRIVLPEGASYALLVIPFQHRMQPDSGLMSSAVAKKIKQLLDEGATILMSDQYTGSLSFPSDDPGLRKIFSRLSRRKKGKGGMVTIPYTRPDFSSLGLMPDLEIRDNQHDITWTHRRDGDREIYFIANQSDRMLEKEFSFRVAGMQPEIWDPVEGTVRIAGDVRHVKERTVINIRMEPRQSCFVIFDKARTASSEGSGKTSMVETGKVLENWVVSFDTAYGGPAIPVKWPEMKSWTTFTDPAIRYYSGTAVYRTSFFLQNSGLSRELLMQFGEIHDIASIKVNGIVCGTLWTKPYRLSIREAVREGENTVEIEVANTWANRLIGDQQLPEQQRVSWTTAPFRLKGAPLLPAGLEGKVKLIFKN